MNKWEFLNALRSKISSLPEADIQKSLDYYAEMIDDRIEDGMSERQAVEELGTPDKIAQEIFSATPITKLVKARVKPSRTLKVWEIVLIVLGSPVWLPLLLAALIVILSVYIVIWLVIISLYASAVALGASSLVIISVIAIRFIYSGSVAPAIVSFGGGLTLIGITVLMFLAVNKITKYAVALSKKIMLCIKGYFVGKGEAYENC